MGVFEAEGPELCDVMAIMPWSMVRVRLRRWEVSVSDLDACLCAHKPQLARPTQGLVAAAYPVLQVWDELQKQDWRTVREALVLRPDDLGKTLVGGGNPIAMK